MNLRFNLLYKAGEGEKGVFFFFFSVFHMKLGAHDA
jgi:hypothetical protein